MENKKATDWFKEVPVVPDPWQERKPKLTKEEIHNAAEVYKTFVDTKNQVLLYRIIKDKCHKETFNVWWPLVCGHNKNPVDDAYTVEQYIKDNNLSCPNAPCYCGACTCE